MPSLANLVFLDRDKYATETGKREKTKLTLVFVLECTNQVVCIKQSIALIIVRWSLLKMSQTVQQL